MSRGDGSVSTTVAWLSVLLTACSSSAPLELDPAQEVLFHVSYENFAWGYVNAGWYVDREGEVWGMSPAPMWRDQVSGLLEGEATAHSYPAAQLETEYVDARDELILQLDRDELEEMTLLIRSAAEGSYSEPASTARDAGLHVFGALLYDPEGRTYRKVVLSIRGDWTVVNEAAAATQLEAKLIDVARRITTARSGPR